MRTRSTSRPCGPSSSSTPPPLARERGLYTALNTNGYILEEAADELYRQVDVVNVDVKAFSDRFYNQVCGASLQEVLDTCLLARAKGVHLELTYLLVPGLNDSEAEVSAFSAWVLERLGPDTPVFFFRFQPSHRLADLPEQSMAVMERSANLARRCGLRYVYLGGVSGTDVSTSCPSCGRLAVERRSLRPPAEGEPREQRDQPVLPDLRGQDPLGFAAVPGLRDSPADGARASLKTL